MKNRLFSKLKKTYTSEAPLSYWFSVSNVTQHALCKKTRIGGKWSGQFFGRMTALLLHHWTIWFVFFLSPQNHLRMVPALNIGSGIIDFHHADSRLKVRRDESQFDGCLSSWTFFLIMSFRRIPCQMLVRDEGSTPATLGPNKGCEAGCE